MLQLLLCWSGVLALLTGGHGDAGMYVYTSWTTDDRPDTEAKGEWSSSEINNTRTEKAAAPNATWLWMCKTICQTQNTAGSKSEYCLYYCVHQKGCNMAICKDYSRRKVCKQFYGNTLTSHRTWDVTKACTIWDRRGFQGENGKCLHRTKAVCSEIKQKKLHRRKTDKDICWKDCTEFVKSNYMGGKQATWCLSQLRDAELLENHRLNAPKQTRRPHSHRAKNKWDYLRKHSETKTRSTIE